MFMALAIAAALHATPAEQFFCDDLHKQTLQQCIRRTREWVCSDNALTGRSTDARIAQLYAETIREERAAVCARENHRAYRKCGPDGTVDWDDNPEYPPPHCNRLGWNGKRYVTPRRHK